MTRASGPAVRVGGQRVPARVAASALARARGHMFRRRRPTYALVFPFDGVATRRLHMLFVPFALEAVFAVDDVVTAVERLRPWTGRAAAEADTVVELPADEYDVEPGDELRVVR